MNLNLRYPCQTCRKSQQFTLSKWKLSHHIEQRCVWCQCLMSRRLPCRQICLFKWNLLSHFAAHLRCRLGVKLFIYISWRFMLFIPFKEKFEESHFQWRPQCTSSCTPNSFTTYRLKVQANGLIKKIEPHVYKLMSSWDFSERALLRSTFRLSLSSSMSHLSAGSSGGLI